MDGMYKRTGIEIAIYENNENGLVIATSDQNPGEPMIITGERAWKLIHELMDTLHNLR